MKRVGILVALVMTLCWCSSAAPDGTVAGESAQPPPASEVGSETTGPVGTVVDPTCADNAKNGSESDVDCGGATCAKCAASRACGATGDCVSGVCANGVCQATCSDGELNGSESDFDCGGATCAKCVTGQHCKETSDCETTVCTAGICQSPLCIDGAKNGTESDVDCGGGKCAKCDAGKACGDGNDCKSGVCTANVCEATCDDKVKNENETDVDCGGGECGKCAVGKACTVPSDCTSAVCRGGTCSAPTCFDDAKNGGETDVDCGGGGACPKCGAGQACTVPSDCLSGTCTNNQCVGTCGPGYAPLVPPIANCRNVAVGRASSATSSYTPANAPDRANDLDRCSYWNSGGFAPATWSVDLGATRPVRGVMVQPAMSPNGNVVHVIETSTDGATFEPRANVAQAMTSGSEYWFDFAAPVDARYLRVRTTSSPSWVGWIEVGVFKCD